MRKIKNLKIAGLMIVLASLVVYLSGCQTVEGLGKDMQSLGEGTSKTAGHFIKDDQ